MEKRSNRSKQLIFPKSMLYFMPMATYILPYYGYMDENEILMMALHKATNGFWK